MALAERRAAPVMFSIELGRIPFPTDHPCYQGCLAVDIARVRHQLAGHDLVLVVGAQVFRYHSLSPGPYLPDATALVAITADPDIAARAPSATPSSATPCMRWVSSPASSGPATVRCPRDGNSRLPQPAPDGSLTREQVLDAIAAERPEDAIFVSEAPSLGTLAGTAFRCADREVTSVRGRWPGVRAYPEQWVRRSRPDRHVVARSGDGSARVSHAGRVEVGLRASFDSAAPSLIEVEVHPSNSGMFIAD